MTTTYRAREFVQTAVLTSHLANFFKRRWRAFQEWRERERLRAILYRLGDRELEDIGLARKIEPDPDRVRQWIRLEWH